MKAIFISLVTILVLTTIGCEDKMNMGDDLCERVTLTTIEEKAENNVLRNINLTYDKDCKLIEIIEEQGNFAVNTYQAVYDDESIDKIIIRTESLAQNTINSITYLVNASATSISLSRETRTIEYELFITNSYINNYIQYYGEDFNNYNSVDFQRDEADKILTINHLTTDMSVTNLPVYKHSFTAWDNEAKLNDAYNPTYYTSFGLYNPMILAILGLDVSSSVPLRSDFMITTDPQITNNVMMQSELDSEDRVVSLNYTIFDNNNSFNMTFDYE